MTDPSASFVVFGRTPFGGSLHVWHHVARRLASSSTVVYVQDPVRMGPRALRPHATVLENRLIDLVPIDFPLQRFRFLKLACDRSLAAAVRNSLNSGEGPVISILYPRASIESALSIDPDLCVYHATDDFSYTWEGRDDSRFLEWEARALRECSLVVATQGGLADRYRRGGHSAVMVQTLGFDEQEFDGLARPVPPELAGLPRPILGYAGSLYAAKIDAPLVSAAARMRPDWSFVFVGEVFDDEGHSLAGLASLPNVHMIGLRPFEQVPSYVHSFDVAIHPQRPDPRKREFTFYALKVFDALAMGRPIVLTPGSTLSRLSPHASYSHDTESFVAAVERALASGNGPDIARLRREAVRDDTWGRKVEEIRTAALSALPVARKRGRRSL